MFLYIVFVGKFIIDLFRPIPKWLKFNKVKMIIQALDISLSKFTIAAEMCRLACIANY
jgi:hypothetical protein